MTEHTVETKVFDQKAYGFNEYFCFNKFKMNVDGRLQIHKELRFAPFVIRTELVKGESMQLKFVFFSLFLSVRVGLI